MFVQPALPFMARESQESLRIQFQSSEFIQYVMQLRCSEALEVSGANKSPPWVYPKLSLIGRCHLCIISLLWDKSAGSLALHPSEVAGSQWDCITGAWLHGHSHQHNQIRVATAASIPASS